MRGELRPGGSGREWCDADVLRRLRRASLAVLRKEIEPADQRALAAFLPSWQGVDKHPPGGAGVDRLREQLVPLQGLALTPETWEREVLPRRVGAYSATWMDALCASGELVWVGAGALGRTNGRVALYFREDAGLIGPPPTRGDPPSEPAHEAVRERLAAGSCFFTDLLIDVDLAPEELQEALWDLAWAGAVTNDAFAPLRAPRLTLARAQRAAARAAGRAGRRFSSRRGGAQAQVQGRWSLTERLFELPAQPVDPSARRRALAELLLERYGILTRELVLAEGVPGGFCAIYPELSQLETLGVARRGYFVEGLGGAQFALPGAVERLRAQKAPEEAEPLVLAATDPAQPYGAALPWPKRDGESAGRPPPPARPARSSCSPAPSPCSTWSAAAERCSRSSTHDDPRVLAALEALADHARAGRIRRIALEKVDGESGDGHAVGGRARRGRLPRGSAQADAQRLTPRLGSAAHGGRRQLHPDRPRLGRALPGAAARAGRLDVRAQPDPAAARAGRAGSTATSTRRRSTSCSTASCRCTSRARSTVLGQGALARVAPNVRRQLVNRRPQRVVLLALGGATDHTGRDGVAYRDWDDSAGASPQEIPLPADVPVERGLTHEKVTHRLPVRPTLEPCPRATRSCERRTASGRCWKATVPDEILAPQARHARDRWPERLRGRAVTQVDTHGKHLFLRFEGDLVLHSHLRMTGAWAVYRHGARWRRAPRRAWLDAARPRARGRRVRRAGAGADDRRAHALRPAPRRARPRRARRAGFDDAALPRSGCAPTTRRAASATRCSTSGSSPASATSGRPRAAGARESTRGAACATSPTRRRSP